MADINDTIAENLGLVYQQLTRFNLLSDPDAESFAYEALYKAIITYDEASGNRFSTYAVCVIANSLRQLIRHRSRKRQLCTVSYNATVDDDECKASFMEVLVGACSVDDIVLRKELLNAIHTAIRRIYNDMTNETSKRILIMWYKSDFKASQQDIAAALKVSQPTVSRNINIIRYKLKQELEDYL